jgi:hypothetical protein
MGCGWCRCGCRCRCTCGCGCGGQELRGNDTNVVVVADRSWKRGRVGEGVDLLATGDDDFVAVIAIVFVIDEGTGLLGHRVGAPG